MKLVTYCHDGELPRVGVVTESGLIDIAAAAPELPPDMLGFITGGQYVLEEVRSLGERQQGTPLFLLAMQPFHMIR